MKKPFLVFDIDGVISHPSEKIANEKILQEIVKKLTSGDLIALNTGRSISWIKEKILDKITKDISNKNFLNNLFVTGEAGGVIIEFGKKGKIKTSVDKSISPPSKLAAQIKSLLSQKYSKFMFFDNTKKTMISVEMIEGLSIKRYAKIQKPFAEELKKIVSKYGLDKQFNIAMSTIAVDVINKKVGKDFATDLIIKWLKRKKIRINKVITFGDSPSDIKVAEKFHQSKFDTELVYVGKMNDIKKVNPEFKFTVKHEQFEQGTLEFLNSL